MTLSRCILVVAVGLGLACATYRRSDVRGSARYSMSSELRGKPQDLGAVKVRYQPLSSTESQLLTARIRDDGRTLAAASADFRFAAGVAAFGLVLRDSPFKGQASLALARALAEPAASDEHRREFLALVDRAGQLEKSRSTRP